MQKRIIDGVETWRGPDNVFADLGLPDADKLRIKTGLVIEIRRAMRDLGLNQQAQAGHGLTIRSGCTTYSKANLPPAPSLRWSPAVGGRGFNFGTVSETGNLPRDGVSGTVDYVQSCTGLAIPVNAVRSLLAYEFETAEAEATYNEWLRAKVAASISDPRPPIPHDEVERRMAERIVALKAQHARRARQ